MVSCSQSHEEGFAGVKALKGKGLCHDGRSACRGRAVAFSSSPLAGDVPRVPGAHLCSPLTAWGWWQGGCGYSCHNRSSVTVFWFSASFTRVQVRHREGGVMPEIIHQVASTARNRCEASALLNDCIFFVPCLISCLVQLFPGSGLQACEKFAK